MDMNRRHFFRVSGAGLVGSSLVALGFSPTQALAQTRNFKPAASSCYAYPNSRPGNQQAA